MGNTRGAVTAPEAPDYRSPSTAKGNARHCPLPEHSSGAAARAAAGAGRALAAGRAAPRRPAPGRSQAVRLRSRGGRSSRVGATGRDGPERPREERRVYPFDLEEQARWRQDEALRLAARERLLGEARASWARRAAAGRRPAGLAGALAALRAARLALGAALRRTPGSAAPRPAPGHRHQPA